MGEHADFAVVVTSYPESMHRLVATSLCPLGRIARMIALPSYPRRSWR